MLIIHVGRHKTGTTSIQHFLYENREALRREGIFYADTGTLKAHHDLAVALKTGDEIDSSLREIQSLDPHANTVLLSSEAFQHLTTSQAQRLVDGYPAKSIIYLREQFAYSWSAYVQRCWAAIEARPFLQTLNPPNAECFYSPFLRRWHEATAGNCVVRIYERKRLVDEDIVADFCSLIGLDKTAYATPLDRGVSLGWRAVNFLRRLNRLIHHDSSLKRLKFAVANVLSSMGANQFPSLLDKPAFPRSLIEDYQGRFHADNEAVSRDFSLPEPLFDLGWMGDSDWNATSGLSKEEFEFLLGQRPIISRNREMLVRCFAESGDGI